MADNKKKKKRSSPVDEMFLEEWDVKPKKRKNKKKAGGGEKALAVNLLLLCGILAMTALGGMLIHRHNSFAEMVRVVEAQTFYDGTSPHGYRGGRGRCDRPGSGLSE